MADFFSKHASRIEAAPSGCWLWSGSADPRGYGFVWWNGRSQNAHRAAYEVENGFGSAAGLHVRHRCDTPACVNPRHLELGTHMDNMRDRSARGRLNHVSKLSSADVLAIRRDYAPRNPLADQRALARRYGVSQATIGQVLLRITWRHV